MNTDQSKEEILCNWGLAIPQETIRAGSCKATKLEMSCRSMHNTLNLNRFFYCNISDKSYHIKYWATSQDLLTCATVSSKHTL